MIEAIQDEPILSKLESAHADLKAIFGNGAAPEPGGGATEESDVERLVAPLRESAKDIARAAGRLDLPSRSQADKNIWRLTESDENVVSAASKALTRTAFDLQMGIYDASQNGSFETDLASASAEAKHSLETLGQSADFKKACSLLVPSALKEVTIESSIADILARL